MTVLFDETLFGHINGPPELLVTPYIESDVDFLPCPGVPPAPVEVSEPVPKPRRDLETMPDADLGPTLFFPTSTLTRA